MFLKPCPLRPQLSFVCSLLLAPAVSLVCLHHALHSKLQVASKHHRQRAMHGLPSSASHAVPSASNICHLTKFPSRPVVKCCYFGSGIPALRQQDAHAMLHVLSPGGLMMSTDSLKFEHLIPHHALSASNPVPCPLGSHSSPVPFLPSCSPVASLLRPCSVYSSQAAW